MANDITILQEVSRDWRSAFEQDKNRRYVHYTKKKKCDLIDPDLLYETNLKNKLALKIFRKSHRRK